MPERTALVQRCREYLAGDQAFAKAFAEAFAKAFGQPFAKGLANPEQEQEQEHLPKQETAPLYDPSSRPTSSTNGEGPIVSPSVPPGFARFRSVYPSKIGKQAALRSWRRQNLEPRIDVVVAGLERQREHLAREGGKFIPNPSTWLNEGRWEDEPREAPLLTSKTAGNIEALGRFIENGDSR